MSPRRACRLLPGLLLALAAASAAAFDGTVVRVTDGDTVRVRPAGGGKSVAVRIAGIDAPEICQAGGRQARAVLAARLQGRPVHVHESGRDDYQRWLGRIAVAGEPDVGAWMVAQGQAWSYRLHGQPGPYDALQAQARRERLGLWAAARPVAPGTFRHAHGPCPRRRSP